MLLSKQKKNQSAGKANRLLISINSAGPIRFVVCEDELVAAVIDTALKSYAREGRLPILGSDLNNFLLYYSNAESDACRLRCTLGYPPMRASQIRDHHHGYSISTALIVENKGFGVLMLHVIKAMALESGAR